MASPDKQTDGLLESGSKSSSNDAPPGFSGDAGISSWLWEGLYFLGDIIASVIFWFVFLFLYIPDIVFFPCLGAMIVLMVIWRLYLAYGSPSTDRSSEVPYTCGYVTMNDKEIFLVATIHISPRAPLDVEAVVNTVRPDVVLIELDDERLDRMRAVEFQKDNGPPESDLQPITITRKGEEPFTVFAQRALWNAEYSDNLVKGGLIFDEENQYGLTKPSDLNGNLMIVDRGGPEGEFAPFALKAHNAARGGADAVVVVNTEGNLPLKRVGGGATITSDLRTAAKTGSCGFPPIPLLLVPHDDGNKMKGMIKSGVEAEFTVLPDHYPRRTLRLRICQAAALMFSGIGVLYGIIQCFGIEVGAEFLAAEIAASAKGIPCACIDVDLNQFWGRLAAGTAPTPCNIGNSLLAWLAFPRIAFRVLFPARGSVDCLGSMVLHGKSFSLRTWIAFLIAGWAAGQITSFILKMFSSGVERGAEETGAVKEENRQDASTWIMLIIELYMLPRVYDAVAASRDEAMYLGLCKRSREFSAKSMVVVVGAGHANGILQKVRKHGL